MVILAWSLALLLTPSRTRAGEAQIAMVDVLGMLSGIGLCTLVGTSRHSIVAAYILLSVVDIAGIYNEIRAVVFTVLNHERTHLVVRDYLSASSDPSRMVAALAPEARSASPAPVPPTVSSAVEPPPSLAPQPRAYVRGDEGNDGSGAASDADLAGGKRKRSYRPSSLAKRKAGASKGREAREAGRAGADAGGSSATQGGVGEGKPGTAPGGARGRGLFGRRGSTPLLSAPSTVARRENIFMNSRLSTNVFKTWSQVRVVFAARWI